MKSKATIPEKLELIKDVANHGIILFGANLEEKWI